MSEPADLAEVFRQLQSGNPAAALEASRAVATRHPQNARARLAAGIALRMLGRYDEAFAQLERAALLDPRDHAPPYESGIVLQLQGRGEEALARFEQARRLRPAFFAAHFSAGVLRLDRREWDAAIECFRAAVQLQSRQVDALLNLAAALAGRGLHEEAEATYVRALATDPHRFLTLKTFGQYSVARGDFKRAATLFAEAARQDPSDEALPMFVAQVELLLGRWDLAWSAYGGREPRRRFERALAQRGRDYRVPAVGDLAGRDVALVAEQGLGDALFFLRWAPWLQGAGARLRVAGHARLHPLLARTGLFASFHEDPDDPALDQALPLLLGDLPQLAPGVDPLSVPTLRIAPLPEKLARWRAALEAAGPRPWIGVTWRAGTPSRVVAHALYKAVAPERLCGALASLGGTCVALQRGIEPGELASASAAFGREVPDFSRSGEDLDDALALLALLDRHVGVSNTNMHLAAAVGATADVLEPYPPEWRWRLEGDSPWFPGFRVHRQSREGDWSQALASAAAGSTSRG